MFLGLLCICKFINGFDLFMDISIRQLFKGQLDPSELSMFQVMIMIPETFRILYGFVSDNYAIFGSKRKNHIILGSIIQILTQITLILVGSFSDFSGNQKYVVPGCFVLAQVFISYNDCVMDALIVQVSKDHHPTAKFLNSIKFMVWGVGIIAAGLSALMVDQFSFDPTSCPKIYLSIFITQLLLCICLPR